MALKSRIRIPTMSLSDRVSLTVILCVSRFETAITTTAMTKLESRASPIQAHCFILVLYVQLLSRVHAGPQATTRCDARMISPHLPLNRPTPTPFVLFRAPTLSTGLLSEYSSFEAGLFCSLIFQPGVEMISGPDAGEMVACGV